MVSSLDPQIITKCSKDCRQPANHSYAVAIHHMCYNFATDSQTLRVTPAMQAGVIDDPVWEAEDTIWLLPD